MERARLTNITRRGRRRRATFGAVALAAGVAALVGLAARGAGWPAGLLTFPFFLLGAVGVLQASAGT